MTPRASELVEAAEQAARHANQNVYEGGDEVRSYVSERYHAVRIELARREVVRALTDERTPRRGPVVELGSGGGAIVTPMPDRSVIYCDIDPAALQAGDLTDQQQLACDVVKGLPFATGSLAALVMGELIEHVYDTRRLLEECHRVLAPGGVLVITTPNLAAIQDRLRFLRGASPRHVDPLHRYLWLHIRPFTPSSLRRVLSAAGFTDVRLQANFVVWRTRSGRKFQSRTLAKLLPAIGAVLVASSRRPAPSGSVSPGGADGP